MNWYYIRNNEQIGPVFKEDIDSLLNKGKISLDSLIWNETLSDWVKFSDLSETKTPPPYPNKSQRRPWVRYWARVLDTTCFFPLLVSMFMLSAVIHAPVPSLIVGVMSLMMPLLAESILISSWGTTPGKWLLSVQVRNLDGSLLSFSQALRRTGLVWVRGVGMGLPIVAGIAQIMAHNRLKSSGKTSWDAEGQHIVKHEKVKLIRFVILFGIILAATISFQLTRAF